MAKLKKTLSKLPAKPGIYYFKNKSGKTIYIGKAMNLQNRVKSYFQKNATLYGAKAEMTGQIETIDWQIVDSEIEALIMETKYIKKYQPKYNVLSRDDKSYLYAAITKEKFPKIRILRRNQIPNAKSQISNSIGPFTDSAALKQTLNILRSAFPFCTCKTPHKHPCLNYHIGKCAGICCAKNQNRREFRITPAEYRKNINNIRGVLLGNKTMTADAIQKEMKMASANKNFERAARLRDQLYCLDNIFLHKKIIRDEVRTEKGLTGISRLLAVPEPKRIEGYDISNTQGALAVGAMAVFTNGLPDKSQYRKFRIKTVTGANDVWMIKEIVSRRLTHREWELPTLVLIDGGKAQLNAARLAMKQAKLSLPVAALAKSRQQIYFKNKIIILKRYSPALQILQRVRDEAHRFAIGYHRNLRDKKLQFTYAVKNQSRKTR